MSERLVSHAEASAESAEGNLETCIRTLFGALAARREAQDTAFPQKLSAAIAPRGEAQVREAKRLTDTLIAQEELPPEVVAATLTVAAAALALSTRLSALDAEEKLLAEAVMHESAAERAFRRSLREVAGLLSALDQHALGSSTVTVSPENGGFAQAPALPQAPPPPKRRPSGGSSKPKPEGHS
ncbi:MAG TPA: hypothetical protein VIK01_07965 [Polyangiaceae bacterium]